MGDIKDFDLPHEDRERRCPKLGGPVTFSYCRIESGDMPCSRSLACWSEVFDVSSFFKSIMDEQEFKEHFNQQGRQKVVTLMELIEKAKQTLNKSDSQSEEQ